MDFEKLMDCHFPVDWSSPEIIDDTRSVYHAPIDGQMCTSHIACTGRHVEARYCQPAADWFSVQRGVGSLDIRAQLLTTNNEFIYMHYDGIVTNKPSNTHGHYIVRAHFESPATSKLAWLNEGFFVGTGLMTSKGVNYTFFRLT